MSVLWQQVNHHPVVGERDFKRFLRYPVARAMEGPLEENAAWAGAWFAGHARPWSAAIRAGDGVRASAAAWFRDYEDLAVVAVSAGLEPELEAAARWEAGEPDRYFFLECYAAAAVEALLAEARRHLGADAHYCPGYPDWHIHENAVLLAAVRAAGALPGSLSMLPSGMLVPKKSQLAVCALRTTPVLAP